MDAKSWPGHRSKQTKKIYIYIYREREGGRMKEHSKSLPAT